MWPVFLIATALLSLSFVSTSDILVFSIYDISVVVFVLVDSRLVGLEVKNIYFRKNSNQLQDISHSRFQKVPFIFTNFIILNPN